MPTSTTGYTTPSFRPDGGLTRQNTGCFRALAFWHSIPGSIETYPLQPQLASSSL
jgi:hypothetical protein